MGITSTPVIDAATNTLYLDAVTKELIDGQQHFIHRLHAIDVASGNEKLGGPAVIADTIFDGTNYTFVSGPSVPGSGDGSVDGMITFNAVRQLQRSALTLAGGTVYIAYSSYGDNPPYHGWLLGFSAESLQLTAAFNDTPNGSRGGYWEAGDKPVVDADGYIYGRRDGTFDAALDENGFPSLGNYGDAVVKLAVDPTSTADHPNVNGWGLRVVDYFAPTNVVDLGTLDLDLGSGGLLLLPDAAGSLDHPHLLVAAGKQGRIYLIDRDNMGKLDLNVDQVVQEFAGIVHASFGTPAYANGSLYYVGAIKDQALAFSVADATITSPTSSSPDSYGYPGSTPVVSANGSDDGILWVLDHATNQLRAYDASDLAIELYNGSQAPDGRDSLGTHVKFTTPLVVNGRVYVGTADSLVSYGLLPLPIASDDSYGNSPDGSLVVDADQGVLSNDDHSTFASLNGGPNPGSLRAILETGPSHGILDLSDDGSFIYTPDAGFLGQDSFVYHVNNGLTNSPPATVVLNIVAAPWQNPVLSRDVDGDGLVTASTPCWSSTN